MGTKKCTICGEVKNLSEFYMCWNNVNKKRYPSPSCNVCQRTKTLTRYARKKGMTLSQHKKEVLRKKNETKKICRCCGESFPKTTDFFFTKTHKQKLKNGETSEYTTFRSACKRCHQKQTHERQISKRCIELGCKREDYGVSWRKDLGYKNLKFKEFENLEPSLRIRIVKEIRLGYKFTTLKNYYAHIEEKHKTWRQRLGVIHRKYDYGHNNLLSKAERSAMVIEQMPDSRLAQQMGMKVNEVPAEIIEAKRTLVLIKRELGLTHSSIKERNIKK